MGPRDSNKLADRWAGEPDNSYGTAVYAIYDFIAWLWEHGFEIGSFYIAPEDIVNQKELFGGKKNRDSVQLDP